jgi:hypothetical protein
MSAFPRGLLLALCAGAAFTAWPRAARADDPESLPTLDDSAPGAAPEAPPVPVTTTPIVIQVPPAPPDSRPELPIRARRRLALLGEVGWNGIAGFGPTLAFHLDPHFTFDLGAGLSLLGWKVGLRGRYNMLTGPVTPFLGVGVMGTAGLGDSPIPINDNNDNGTQTDTVNIRVLPSAFLQTVGGVDWTSKSGFTLLGTVGYAWLLSHDPVQVTSGTPTADERRAFDIAFRSNVVATVAIGYSFR